MFETDLIRLQRIKELYELIDVIALDVLRVTKTDIPVKDIKELVSYFGGEIVVGISNNWIDKTGPDSFNIYVDNWNFPLFNKFYIAARLGDVILHTNYLSDRESYLNSKEFMFKPDTGLTTQVDQSNEFAYGLLMPEDIYRKVLYENTKGNDVHTKNIAEYFEVPISAASERGKRLGLIKR